MIVQLGVVAAIGDGVEIEIEDLRFGKQQRSESADPTAQQLFLVAALGAVGIIRNERFLRQDVESGEESESFIEIEVVDVAASFLVEEFEDQQAEQGVGRGNHSGTRITGLVDELIEAELSQHWEKQEQTGNARAERAFSVQGEQSAVGDGGPIGASSPFLADGTRRSSAWRRSKKGGVSFCRMLARN